MAAAAVAPEATARQGARGRVAFAALIAFTAVLLLSPQSYVPALATLRPAFLFAALAATAHALACLLARRRLAPPGLEARLVLGLAAWAVLSVPFSYWPGGSLAMITAMYLKSVAVFFLVSGVVDTAARLRTLAWALTLMALPIAWTGVSNFRSGRFLTVPSQSRIFGYDAPLTANPNDLALTLNLILPLSLALLLSTRAWTTRLGLGAAVLLLASAVILTYSRAGFLTLATTALAYAVKLLWRPQRVLLPVVGAAALCALPLLPSGYLERLATIGAIDSDPTGSAQARWRDMGAAFEFLTANPVLGAGAGMNALALNERRGDHWTEVHNVYLEYGMDLGLPGLGAFLLLLVACFASAGRARRAAQRSPAGHGLAQLCEGIQLSLLAFAVAAFFHPAGYEFYFYFFGGLAVAARAVALADPDGHAGAGFAAAPTRLAA